MSKNSNELYLREDYFTDKKESEGAHVVPARMLANKANINNPCTMQNAASWPANNMRKSVYPPKFKPECKLTRHRGMAIYLPLDIPQYFDDENQHEKKELDLLSIHAQHLNIFPPALQEDANGEHDLQKAAQVTLQMSVVRNSKDGEYRTQGVPQHWLTVLTKQFGVKPQHLPYVDCGYNAKIPKVLVMLKKCIIAGNGYYKEGIFRLAPKAADCDKVKALIEQGKLEWWDSTQYDVNVFANLLKVWLRELPDRLLSPMQVEEMELQSEQQCREALQSLPEPNKSIFFWLCDLCVEVVQHEQLNKMTAQNLAIVIAPNLLDVEKCQNSMTSLRKVMEFFVQCIVWRQRS